MDTDLLIKDLKSIFSDNVIEVAVKNRKRATLTVKPSAVPEIAEHLYKKAGFRFIIASALHTKKGFEIYYHFSNDATGLVLNVHVILDSEKPEIESLSNMFNASNWIEREMHELFGINFLNHPNQEKLISEGNWADGVYPYRKEFKK
ncbi:MAG: NADH-quinone oxidoreductase subunit C [Bacteroidales bacterium]|nr:NADH-quinone oxidoreductase subunit C [Bacteroidales bacterium]